MRLTSLSCPGLLILTVTAAAAQAPSTGPSFTEAQAGAGQIEFERKCASCHLPDADGERRAPALIGPRFVSTWGDRRVRDLFVRMRDGMPPIGVRPRGDAYTNILAFLLRENGQPAGSTPLDPLSYGRLTAEAGNHDPEPGEAARSR